MSNININIGLDINEYKNGEIISNIIVDLYNQNKYDNVLFIRTPTTGNWLDILLNKNINITRILYDTYKINNYTFHKSTIIIDHNNLKNTLISINKKFDLIAIDTFHEYNYSKNDLYLLYMFLTENGTMICHDCFPSNKLMATPKFKFGDWCGETYIAFIDFAYNNPQLFYCILKIDTGIGIISKVELELLKNKFNIKKQKKMLSYHMQSKNVYKYFYKNHHKIMNVIDI